MVLTDAKLINELSLIMSSLSSKYNLQFKPLEDKVLIKMGRDIATIPPHHQITYAIKVYGVFIKNGGATAYLQYDICEFYAEKVHLLKPRSWSPVQSDMWSENANHGQW